MSKTCHFLFQNKNETWIFAINKPNIMKKSKYQQYLHCFIVCIVSPNVFWWSTVFRGGALIRGRHLFQCGYPKVRRLCEVGPY